MKNRTTDLVVWFRSIFSCRRLLSPFGDRKNQLQFSFGFSVDLLSSFVEFSMNLLEISGSFSRGKKTCSLVALSLSHLLRKSRGALLIDLMNLPINHVVCYEHSQNHYGCLVLRVNEDDEVEITMHKTQLSSLTIVRPNDARHYDIRILNCLRSLITIYIHLIP